MIKKIYENNKKRKKILYSYLDYNPGIPVRL